MIPLSLHLSNFLSYQAMPEPLDLSAVHLACLSGPNGHGKSALLDAITWALWGKARGCEGGQEQERLIRDGADAMRVEFVFELEGQIYRVARTRWRNGKGDIVLNMRAGDGSWTDLAGEGILDTQRRIVERLRMEYETFVASAFILQGRADTFTRMDPRDRKQVLGKILSLEIYERLADRARERKREAQAEADAHGRQLETLERDLTAKDELDSRAAAARDALARAESERTEAGDAVAVLQGRHAELKSLEAVGRETRKRRDDAASAMKREEEHRRALERKAADLVEAARIGDELRAAAETLPRLESEETKWEDARTRHEELGAEAASLEARLGEERSRLDAERGAAERSVAALEKELSVEPQARDLLERAEGELATLDGVLATRESLQSRRTEIKTRQGVLEAEGRVRETEREETAEKLSLLEETGASCPVCGQKLTAAHRKQVWASLSARIKELATLDRAAARQMRALATDLLRLDEESKELKRALETREAMSAQAGALRAKLDRLDEVRRQLEVSRRAAAEIAARVTGRDFAHGERDKLARIREEIARVGFDSDAYRELKAVLGRSREAERALARARHAEEALTSCRREAEAVVNRIDNAGALLKEAESDLMAIGERLAALPAVAQELQAAERARTAAQAGVEESGKMLAAAEQALMVLERKAVEASDARAARTAAKRTAALYEKLAKTFGRDGIPARIIGNAIPELRIEANRLLGMLSDGQLSLSIDPVRETKSRGMRETLEVTVFDAAGGKRAYEMYSGGERLRIDFALRVALSRLLATRAGARLETLVVDEGFGSQDTEGRLRLLEAVMRVRSEFRTVLVITHIEELKEHFPVRIEVRKDPEQGSLVSMF